MKIIFVNRISAADIQVGKGHTAKYVMKTNTGREMGAPVISQETRYMLLLFSSSLSWLY